jgi:hypothetical protein
MASWRLTAGGVPSIISPPGGWPSGWPPGLSPRSSPGLGPLR